ncbi:MAG: hypothetical protein UT08_C0001G0022 [Candidatus Woesebacteria bacterium GW2011_GWB1_38_8]|uniref:Glycosyltransferase 2-like domain-containing protein n=1 Tax=Candidatus Woesebacteria bacterium GW2011_GWB1_38_8 TaxID=1618570 RepID=A0A0G0PA41_9BACT|nr:MAG: hypothetical protein UT08_C0001G0022 [Candidatus Woesebacteria bacterium GW2011_GWB1_38_8]
MKNNPQISIVLPSYNSAKYLEDSVNSILNQTFKDFELIIIDDGSKDNTQKILNKFNDKRIKKVKHKKNIGLVRSLNEGIRLAKGKYLARMDADDVCFPDRLISQINFLKSNPDITFCGTLVKTSGDYVQVWNLPLYNDEMKVHLLFGSPLAHPSVLIRRINDFYYDENYQHVEDYELWFRLSKKYKMANIAKVLLNYRMYADSATNRNDKKVLKARKNIVKIILNNLRLFPSNGDLNLHLSFWETHYEKNQLYIARCLEWFRTIAKKNKDLRVYSQFELNALLGAKLLDVLVNYYGLNIKTIYYMLNSGFFFDFLRKYPIKKFRELKNRFLYE